MAFVVLSGAPDSLQLVDLGGKLESDVNAIDDAVARYREAIGAVGRDFLQPAAPSDAQRLEAMSGIGRKARELVFDPLRPTLNGLRRLFLAPDASLTFLPFEALPFDDGGFVLDDCTVSYLTTGRDLTGFGPRQGEPSAAVVAADPDFDLAADADAPASMAGRRSSDLDRGHTLQRLNGARAEGSRSARQASSHFRRTGRNDGLNWPHCDGFIWPQLRPMGGSRFELHQARARGAGGNGIQGGVVRSGPGATVCSAMPTQERCDQRGERERVCRGDHADEHKAHWKIPAGWQALELPAGEGRGMTVSRRGVMNFVYDPT